METVISFTEAAIAREDVLVLSNINFEIKKGTFTYLIGRVGSGKSSIIKTLTAEIPLLQGEAIINNFQIKNIKQKQIPQLRRNIGIVFQDFQLLTDRNIYENLAFVLKATGWKNKADIDKRINEVMEEVEILDKLLQMPQQLSGGEQQKIVIARALLNRPNIILADEPTGNLDPISSDMIMNILFKLVKEGHTVIMATHNTTLLKKYPARVLKCENQKVTELTEETIDINDL